MGSHPDALCIQPDAADRAGDNIDTGGAEFISPTGLGWEWKTQAVMSLFRHFCKPACLAWPVDAFCTTGRPYKQLWHKDTARIIALLL